MSPTKKKFDNNRKASGDFVIHCPPRCIYNGHYRIARKYYILNFIHDFGLFRPGGKFTLMEDEQEYFKIDRNEYMCHDDSRWYAAALEHFMAKSSVKRLNKNIILVIVSADSMSHKCNTPLPLPPPRSISSEFEIWKFT